MENFTYELGKLGLFNITLNVHLHSILQNIILQLYIYTFQYPLQWIREFKMKLEVGYNLDLPSLFHSSLKEEFSRGLNQIIWLKEIGLCAEQNWLCFFWEYVLIRSDVSFFSKRGSQTLWCELNVRAKLPGLKISSALIRCVRLGKLVDLFVPQLSQLKLEIATPS